MNYHEYWEKIYTSNEQLNSLILSYWREFSNAGSWQFWVVVFLMVFPLFLLYFAVDRSRVFELFFFGYTIHVLWAYVDIVLARHGYFVHTYFLTPLLPYALNMTASALPVGFLLLYQYCSNHRKNFYLYSALLSGIFTFVFAPIEAWAGFVEFRRGMNVFYLFIIDIVLVYCTYWFTRLIIRFQKTAG